MWDSASDITLIKHKKARSLGAHGKNTVVSITKVGNIVEQCNTKRYVIKVHDRWGGGTYYNGNWYG